MEKRDWKPIAGFDFEEILFEEYHHIAKVTINRPRYRNAFTPRTVWEMSQAFNYCREALDIRVVILTGAGDKAFCSGGDMHVKGRGGYVGGDGIPRLNVLDLQMQIRRLPKPVIAMVNGYAIGGGHVLHVVCDLTVASDNAVFGQTGPKVGSFDAGFGASYLARIVGQKKAREIWFLCRQYSAVEAERMGLVNKVVPFDRLEDECVEWAETMMERSPLALRMMKAGFNAELDGQAGIQELAETPPCSITRSTRHRRAAGPSSRNASLTSANTRSSHKRPTPAEPAGPPDGDLPARCAEAFLLPGRRRTGPARGKAEKDRREAALQKDGRS